jgi:predicted porin
VSTEEHTDLDPIRDNFDIGWSAGAGYLSRIGLGVNARYNYGFRNVVKEDSNGNSIGDLENRVIQIGLVYHFGAHK